MRLVVRRTLPYVLAMLMLMFGLGFMPTEMAKGSTTVYVTRTGSKYHRGGCQYLRRSKIKMTLREAVDAGYDPCSVCDPPTLSHSADNEVVTTYKSTQKKYLPE